MNFPDENVFTLSAISVVVIRNLLYDIIVVFVFIISKGNQNKIQYNAAIIVW